MQHVLDGSQLALMTTDPDLTITYVNPAMQSLLSDNLAAIQALRSDFDPQNIVGMAVSDFHPQVDRVAARLDNPDALPFKTEIRVGEASLSLRVNAQYDASGTHVGFVTEWADVTEVRRQEALSDAISRSQAVIEFNMDGTIVTANDNFLATLGYTLEEIQGQHHRMFVDSEYAESAEYHQFWAELNEGKFSAGEFKRIAKDGREVWIQATYNPIPDMNGRACKVVKYATDITEAKLRTADFEGQLAAIGKAQAVIEFNLDGTIITANDNFLAALGYTLEEIQ